MTGHAANLGRAARLIRRLADIDGSPSEFEGASLIEIAGDVLLAQNEAMMRAAFERVGLTMAPTPAIDNVVPFPEQHSRRVGA